MLSTALLTAALAGHVAKQPDAPERDKAGSHQPPAEQPPQQQLCAFIVLTEMHLSTLKIIRFSKALQDPELRKPE